MVNGCDIMPYFGKAFPDAGFIIIKTNGYPCIREKKTLESFGTQEIAYINLWIIQVGFTCIGRVADQ
jgi:hypothetical protein